MTESEELIQQLRSKATELLLREEYTESVQAYTQLISLCQEKLNQNDPSLRKSLCLALSNRAEARSKLGDLSEALKDCDRALEIENHSHFKTLLCKGKILMSLNKYSAALDCLRAARQNNSYETLNGLLKKWEKTEALSRTGAFDISDWVVSNFRGNPPELAEFVGPIEIKRSEISGRGIFATRNVEVGTLMFVSKAVAADRSILGKGEEPGENLQLDMWKNLVEKVANSCSKSSQISALVSTLSHSGENDETLEVPEISLFRPETESSEQGQSNTNALLDRKRVLGILDVNSLVEGSEWSSKVLGRNAECYGIGLWVLPAMMNHSCSPNSRRVHIGDYAAVHASRDLKAGEELTFAYFDVLKPLDERRETAQLSWGFHCQCKRCKFESEGKREKRYSRASNWSAFLEARGCQEKKKRWAAEEVVVESVAEAIGSDERLIKVLTERRKSSDGGCNFVEMEKVLFRLWRGLYGKIMKRQALKLLLDNVIICS